MSNKTKLTPNSFYCNGEDVLDTKQIRRLDMMNACHGSWYEVTQHKRSGMSDKEVCEAIKEQMYQNFWFTRLKKFLGFKV